MAAKTKTKKSKINLGAIEDSIRKAAPRDAMVVPINLRSVYEGEFENFFVVFDRNGLLYIVGHDEQTIEKEVYKALNPHHMAFNEKTLKEMYRLYS